MTNFNKLNGLISSIINGQQRRKKYVNIFYSKYSINIIKALCRNGYINGYLEVKENYLKVIWINLRYYNGTGVIKNIDWVSKPGRRIYNSIKKLNKIENGLGLYLLSTSKGVLSNHEALNSKIGGEVIVKII